MEAQRLGKHYVLFEHCLYQGSPQINRNYSLIDACRPGNLSR